IAISDVDDADNGTPGDEPMQVSLAVTHGTLSLSGTAGLAFTAGANGSASLTVTGTLAALNTALDGLSYIPAPNYNGPDTLSLLTNDLGSFGSGGPLTASSTVAITVNAVNDAPANSVPAAQATSEDTALVFSAANGNLIAISDV